MTRCVLVSESPLVTGKNASFLQDSAEVVTVAGPKKSVTIDSTSVALRVNLYLPKRMSQTKIFHKFESYTLILSDIKLLCLFSENQSSNIWLF